MALKFHFFPAVFPDETLHSVLSRYARLCGVRSCGAVFDGAQSANFFSQNVAFPCRLAELAEALPYDTGLSLAAVIKRHTQLPYYEPFLTQRMRPAKSSTQPRNAWTWCALNLSGHQF
ncbi:TniQ family protein [Pseudomonas rhodesiae]|uniref:TniQ family protein n=1 Tax=Pseudomonas rhodesiae TaxID=76760 RepID=UPI0009F35DD0|nr:TniQ family protein [Pseudomonas rhodesiae]